MKKLFAVVLVSVLATGCGINVKRSVEDNVLTSNASPAIRWKLPDTFQLVKSSSDKKFSEYNDGFSGSFNDEEWFLFSETKSKKLSSRNVQFTFLQAGVRSYILDEFKGKEYFAHGNATVKGYHFKTAFIVSDERGEGGDYTNFGCRVNKLYKRTFSPKKSRALVIIYSEGLPCNEAKQLMSSSMKLIEIDQRSYQLMNRL